MGNLFEGLKVLDITNNLAGPGAAALWADYGAEVIKIEKPVYGDDVRAFPVFVDGYSLANGFVNRGKKSVVLNRKDPVSVEIVKKMVTDVDILVESNRPGVMKRLGLDYDTLKEINPRLIYCSISAFGQTGPYAQRPGYDVIAQGFSGIMDMTGEPDGGPTKIGPNMADTIASMNAFGSISAALYYRERTGMGQQIDISLARGMFWICAALQGAVVDQLKTRTGNHDMHLCPYGLFNGSNGQSIIIAAANVNTWKNLCKVMGREDLSTDPEYMTNNKRAEKREVIVELIESWLKTFDDIKVPEKMMMEAGVPCIKVYTLKDLLEDPHANACGWIGKFPVQDGITSISYFPDRNGMADFSAVKSTVTKAPALGQHNHEILTQYGLTDEEIDAYEKKWVAEVKGHG